MKHLFYQQAFQQIPKEIIEIAIGISIGILFIVIALIALNLVKKYFEKRIPFKISPFVTLFVIIGNLIALEYILLNIPFLKEIEEIKEVTVKVIPLVWTLIGGIIGFRLVNIFTHYLSSLTLREAFIFKPLSLLIKIIIIITVLAISLGIFNIDITPYILGWGLLGFAIALALQPILQDLFSGMYVSMAFPYKPNDIIQLPSGEICKIVETKSLHTILYDLTKKTYIKLSNTDLVKLKIITFEKTGIKTSLPFFIFLNSDVEGKKKKILETVSKINGISNKIPPSIHFTRIETDKVNFNLSFVIENIEKIEEIISEINEKVLKILFK